LKVKKDEHMENIVVNCINCNEKFFQKYTNFFKKFKVIKVDDLIKKYNEENVIEKDNKLKDEYIKFKILYENGGLLIDGNFEFLYSLETFFENNFFISYSDDKNISTKLMYSNSKNNHFVKKIIDLIKKNKFENITDLFADVLEKDMKNNYNSLQKFDNQIFIYPYEYFYPIDYEWIGKSFTDNTKAVYYEKNRKVPKKAKIKIKMAKKYGVESFNYFFSTLRTVKNNLGYKKYIVTQNIKKKFSVKEDPGIDTAKEKLQEYIKINLEAEKSGKQLPIDYVIIHNPRWLGVTSATKELFKNLLPLEEVFLDKNVNLISDMILKSKVKQVIFSAFDYGWDKIAIRLKKLNPEIKIKSFWHGSHSQVIEKINWETNVMIINLHKQGIIDVMGTCKESLVNFYKSQGYKTAFLNNTVVLNDELKKRIENKKKNIQNTDKLKLGLYSAGTDWRKNTYNQVMAASLFKNATLEVIPLRYELQKIAYKNDLNIIGSDSHLKREDLLLEMAKNDITLYVTFSECAPMLPIESLEVGTICITGNNHHYFDNTKLYDYLVVEREDDVMAIYEKINYALEHKDEIFKLYKEWKKSNDERTKKSVEEFLNM
jgi:glycosyltransferase, group 1 family